MCSVSLKCSNTTVSPVPHKMTIEEYKYPEIEIHSLLLMDQNTFEGN